MLAKNLPPMSIDILSPFRRLAMRFRRKAFLRRQRERLTCRDFTLITNNCLGGILYHQLGMRFLSPTINIAIFPEDYIAFCQDLAYYVGCRLVDVSAEMERPYPVGRLIPTDTEHRPVTLHFIHYASFAEAAERWAARVGRINYDRLIFLYDHTQGPNEALFRAFEALPGRKLAIVQEKMAGAEHYCILPAYDAARNLSHLFDRDGYTGRRVCNRYDFVAFFNGEMPDAVDLSHLPPVY